MFTFSTSGRSSGDRSVALGRFLPDGIQSMGTLRSGFRKSWLAGLALAVGMGFCSEANAQYGSTLNGLGPAARSMAGTTTAAPIDTLGAMQWNPATITALPSSVDFGLELLMPQSNLSSTVTAGSLGNGFRLQPCRVNRQ